MERQKLDSDKIVQLFNQKFNEAEALKQNINSLHQTITNQQKALEQVERVSEISSNQSCKEHKPVQDQSSVYKEVLHKVENKLEENLSFGNCSKIS